MKGIRTLAMAAAVVAGGVDLPPGLWPVAKKFTPNRRISSRKTALHTGNRLGLKCARGFGVMGRDAARIAVNDYVKDHRVPERWRKLFARAFVRAAIKVGR